MAIKDKLISTICAAAISMVAALVSMSACSADIDDERVPRARVYIPFTTVGDWNIFGVHAALQSRRFIPQLREPAGYVWTAISAAGYGGILLTADAFGNYWVFDLCCPVERDPQVRVEVAKGATEARCPKCGSTYDVFSLQGHPVSGRATELGYGLRHYRVGPGRANSAYMVVSF